MKAATLVVDLYDVGVPESERSVQIKNAKGLVMRDLAAGLEKLMAKKLSDASIAKLAEVSDEQSWLARLFFKKDTVGSHLPRHNIFKATRSAGKLCLWVDS
jgi:hypothetical protein